MSRHMFPQTPSPNPDFNREGGLTFRDLAAIELAAQMSGAITFSALDDGKKAKNLAAIPTIAVELAEALERELEATKDRQEFDGPKNAERRWNRKIVPLIVTPKVGTD